VNITTTQADGKALLKIAGELRIASVADAKPAILASLADSSEIQLDLSEVDQCDTAGIQLLLMACASARASGKSFATLGHTAALQTALTRAGIPAELLAYRTDERGNGHGNDASE
jgi:anti-sigma B factor antagonist